MYVMISSVFNPSVSLIIIIIITALHTNDGECCEKIR